MQITDTADNERWKQALHGTFKSLGDDLFLRSTFKADLVLQPGSMENLPSWRGLWIRGENF